MHILFTRPLEESTSLIIRFKELGHKVSHLPVIKIKKEEHNKLIFNDYAAIIFTSSNSLKNLNLDNFTKSW